MTLLGEVDSWSCSRCCGSGESGYAVSIRDEIAGRAAVTLSRGTVYITLDRLERLGYVRSWFAEPTPERGGKAKRHFAIERAGLAVLRDNTRAIERLRQGTSLAPAGDGTEMRWLLRWLCRGLARQRRSATSTSRLAVSRPAFRGIWRAAKSCAFALGVPVGPRTPPLAGRSAPRRASWAAPLADRPLFAAAAIATIAPLDRRRDGALLDGGRRTPQAAAVSLFRPPRARQPHLPGLGERSDSGQVVGSNFAGLARVLLRARTDAHPRCHRGPDLLPRAAPRAGRPRGQGRRRVGRLLSALRRPSDRRPLLRSGRRSDRTGGSCSRRGALAEPLRRRSRRRRAHPAAGDGGRTILGVVPASFGSAAAGRISGSRSSVNAGHRRRSTTIGTSTPMRGCVTESRGPTPKRRWTFTARELPLSRRTGARVCARRAACSRR